MDNFILQDSKARERALDPTKSFIVQAPAGSGKTELLTQRFLNLLKLAKDPEEIISITFTKKSAREMRNRIINALKKANEPNEPTNHHEKKTWNLAKSVLKQDQINKWNLLDNPNRLQIQTIDSLNASITRRLPLLSHFGAPIKIADNPYWLYQEAVQEFLSHLEENVPWSLSIEKLLIHMDNDLKKVENLLINMLAKRDQWLPYITFNLNNSTLKNNLEINLEHIITDTLEDLFQLFPKLYINELIIVANYAAENLLKDGSTSQITILKNITNLPGYNVDDKDKWKAISKLLLTEEGQWRKSVNKNQGFPQSNNFRNPEEKNIATQMKERIKNLLDCLNHDDILKNKFLELNLLPKHFYENTQWETLEALYEILRITVAQLKCVFQQHGKIDYIENAEAALTALGSDDNPTDLTLALDYKIQHLLIDEFQDTSNTQYRLITKLVSGWQEGDGKTLFIVGDPMQSIYRFREAEVGLFIRTKKIGIAHIKLEPLILSVNFRSSSNVVNWINEHFAKIFPTLDDITNGAVTYSKSIASIHANNNSAVTIHSFINSDDAAQAEAVLKQIVKLQNDSTTENIAILVRSRIHLNSIIPALKKSNIPFRAVNIERLTEKPHIQDLLSLTRALLFPTDRIAWLAILRAPWCGLTLSELLIIAKDKLKIIWLQCQLEEILSELSINSRINLQRILPILKNALNDRGRFSLRTLIENTWLQLGGPATCDSLSDLEDSESFFQVLEKCDEAGGISNISILYEAVNELYAAPNNNINTKLQIMTIHNAKGLEFDAVILPFLERKSSRDDKELLLWMERQCKKANEVLILAPIQAVTEKTNLIYDYITFQNNIKNSYENARLLYVATTRAKKELHLFFNLETSAQTLEKIKPPAPNSLLEKLWPALSHNISTNYNTSSIPQATSNKLRPIKRLTSTWENPLKLNDSKITFHNKKSGFNLSDINAKIIGILIHQILQKIAEFGTNWWRTLSNIQNSYIERHLIQLGMCKDDILNAAKIIQKGIENTLNDSRGLWILENHLDAHSELSLSIETQQLVIDRTFVDNAGTRWIIDYKSSNCNDDNLDKFLQEEKQKYEKQLWEYFKALKELEYRPIKVGLYFPLIPAWMEWHFDV